MTDTLTQAIQPKVVGPLFKNGVSTFVLRSNLELGLVPLLIQGTRSNPREGVGPRAEARERLDH